MLVEQRGDGLWIADREALATWLRRSPETIRKRCQPLGYLADGRAVYDMLACERILGTIRKRRSPS